MATETAATHKNAAWISVTTTIISKYGQHKAIHIKAAFFTKHKFALRYQKTATRKKIFIKNICAILFEIIIVVILLYHSFIKKSTFFEIKSTAERRCFRMLLVGTLHANLLPRLDKAGKGVGGVCGRCRWQADGGNGCFGERVAIIIFFRRFSVHKYLFYIGGGQDWR